MHRLSSKKYFVAIFMFTNPRRSTGYLFFNVVEYIVSRDVWSTKKRVKIVSVIIIMTFLQ